MNNEIIKISQEFGTYLSSRDRAADLRARIEHSQSVFELDFQGVESVSGSFADELFGELARHYGESWFRSHVKVLNLDPFVRKVILRTLAESTVQPN